MTKREHDSLVGDIVAYLTARGYLVTATANGADMTPVQRTQLARQGVRRGVPDVLCFDGPGSAPGLAVEVKTGAGRLTPEQERWLDWLRSRGWVCVVARSLQDVTEVM